MSNILRHGIKPVLSCVNVQLQLQKDVRNFSFFINSTKVFSSQSPVCKNTFITNVSPSPSSLLSGKDGTLNQVQVTQTAGIKHVANPNKRCRHCYFQIIDEQRYVMCTKNPRHYTAEKIKNKKWGNYVFTHATTGSSRQGDGNGSRHMKTQQSFRLDY